MKIVETENTDELVALVEKGDVRGVSRWFGEEATCLEEMKLIDLRLLARRMGLPHYWKYLKYDLIKEIIHAQRASHRANPGITGRDEAGNGTSGD